MPTTLTGLLLFLVLLLPGFAYMSIKERNTPRARRSPFRETVEIAAASVTSEVIVLVGYLATVAIWPSLAPDIHLGKLIDEGWAYFATHPLRPIATLAAGMLAVATAGAAVAGVILGRRPLHASKMSSWYEMFESWYPGFNASVGCTLDDGSYVEGTMHTYNDLADETPDRDLILIAPIRIRPPGATDLTTYAGSAVCISAHRIVMMLVTPLTTKRGEATTSQEKAAEVEAAPVAEAAAVHSAAAVPAHAPDPGYDQPRQPPH